MCFRPAETELPPVICTECGKRINSVAGQLPTKCPFCKTSTEGMAAPEAVKSPQITSAPTAPSGAAPAAVPSPPRAPKPPKDL